MNTTVEQDIQAKGLTAPRVTHMDIEAEIRSEVYFTARDGIANTGSPTVRVKSEYVEGENILEPLDRLTFCVIVLRNGFTVTGESACASPENFDAEVGRWNARQKAFEKVLPLLGFRLRDQLAQPVLTEADALADLRGEPRPA